MVLLDSLSITFIIAIVSASIEIGVMLVLIWSLKELKKQSKSNTQHLKSQMNIEKNSLTFRFADWISSEVKYYSPLYKENKNREYVLSPKKIDKHLISIAKKVIVMGKEKIVDIEVMKDEIGRLILTLENMENGQTEIIADLKKLL